MDQVEWENEQGLLTHIAALERRGCQVRRDLNGQFIVKLPDGGHIGETLTERSTAHEWMTVLEAVEKLGITHSDL